MNRAYSILHIKSVDADKRVIAGLATSPEPDRMGDIIEPMGVQFKNPLPFLLYHDAKKPVGLVRFKKPTKAGIEFEATLPTIEEPGTLKDRVDEAWQSVKAGLVSGVSIGFRAIEEDFNKETGGFRFIKSEVLELSLVSIPANASATIHTIKSLDASLGASANEPGIESRTSSAGATASSRVVKTQSRSMKKTITEQISAFEATRQAKTARADDIMTKAADEGATLDQTQKDEYDGLVDEVKEIDEHLVRLAALETRNKAAAKPINGDTPEKASASRAGQHVITVKDNLPPGIRFARFAACLASAQGNRGEALEIAKARYPDEHDIHFVLTKAVEAGTTSDAGWAGNLVQYQDFAGDFIEFLRPQTIIGKFGTNGIPSLNRVPFNIRVAGQDVGGSGYWVGEGKPKPVTKFGFSTTTLQWNKVANIAVLTQEEVRFSSPSAEAKVRDALAAALVERLDIDFVNPAKAAVSGVSPASITNGVVATAPTGVTAAYFRADFKSLLAPFISANNPMSSLVLIMSTTQALSLSLIQNALGQAEFPTLSMKGGSLQGIPVIVSDHLSDYGSPSTEMIIAVNANDIYLADDGNVTIDASREASIEMLSSALQQDATAGTGASLVSMFQSNCLAIKAERFITWAKRRTHAAQYISPAAYVG